MVHLPPINASVPAVASYPITNPMPELLMNELKVLAGLDKLDVSIAKRSDRIPSFSVNVKMSSVPSYTSSPKGTTTLYFKSFMHHSDLQKRDLKTTQKPLHYMT